MNIKHYLSAMAALAMLAACSDYDPGMSENAVDLTDAEIETIQEYTANFVERYGEMDPNHTWGFGELAELEKMGTRAVQVDRNNWAVAIRENNTVVGVTTAVGTDTQNPNGSHYYEYTTKEGYIIPGFPSTVDGKYYIEENNQQVGYTEDEIKSKMQGSQVQPVGDVTDEEIEYVSWWFRTHPNIDSEVPPFTEYFVQDISQDFDRETYPDGNWKDVSNGERQVPVKLYNNGQYVRDEGSEGINYGMDYFSVKTRESDGTDFWEHNNNLNKQKANPMDEYAPATADDISALRTSTKTYPNRTLKYWTSEGPSPNTNGQTVYKNGEGYTTSFSFHNSNDNHDYQHYLLVHLTFKGPRTGLDYDGWYLGFDYELHKQTDIGNNQVKKTDVERDGYYSNWIVKLAPGNPEFYDEPDERVRTIERRVMCEDLGSTFDFDFNDLVFDVKYTREEKYEDGNWVPKNSDGWWDATITLQAVGGTLPIYITNFDGTEYDAHELMGGTLSSNGTYSPVNVGTGATHDPVTLDKVRVASTNPDNIVIRVTSPDKEERGADKVTTMILPSPSGRQSFGENLAPQKICMPVDVRWTKEYQQIEWAYPHFAEWVQNQNGAAGFGNESDWTRTDVDETKLYK